MACFPHAAAYLCQVQWSLLLPCFQWNVGQDDAACGLGLICTTCADRMVQFAIPADQHHCSEWCRTLANFVEWPDVCCRVW